MAKSLYSAHRGQLSFEPGQDAELGKTGSTKESALVLCWALVLFVYWFATWSATRADNGGDIFLASFSIIAAAVLLAVVYVTPFSLGVDGADADVTGRANMPVDDVPESFWQRSRKAYTFSLRRTAKQTAVDKDATQVVGLKLSAAPLDVCNTSSSQAYEMSTSWIVSNGHHDESIGHSPSYSYREPDVMMSQRHEPYNNQLELPEPTYEEDDYLSVITLSDIDTSEIAV